MGRRKTGRVIDGIVLLDKPQGMTSNGALQRVKRLYDARKAGHTGSLDPFATGMLPLCLGQATKISAYLLAAAKHYRVCACLGRATDSGDLTGEVVDEVAVPALEEGRIINALADFHGPIKQVPPMYSALKQGGRRLYQYAREGVTVERPARPVTIHHVRLIRFGANQLELDVACSKGTYIRTLVEDIAKALGTLAHASALRRLSVAPFEQNAMVTMEQLEGASEVARQEFLLPLDAPLLSLPALSLAPTDLSRLRHGQAVQVAQLDQPGLVRVYGPENLFAGIGEWRMGVLRAKRLLAHSDLR